MHLWRFWIDQIMQSFYTRTKYARHLVHCHPQTDLQESGSKCRTKDKVTRKLLQTAILGDALIAEMQGSGISRICVSALTAEQK